MGLNLEMLLRNYNFAPKKRALFRQKRIYIDDIPDDLTKTGYRAYHTLVSFIYDLGKLTGEENAAYRMIDVLDQITTEQY